MNASRGVWWLFVVAGMVGAGQARADLLSTSTSPYSLTVSESLAVLANPGNSNIAEIAGLTTGHELAVERSEPYLLLTNTSDTTMTSFQMTIGNTADHFTFANVVGVLTSAGVSMTSSLGSANQDLTLDLTGLAPGESIAFRVGLAPNDSSSDPLVSYGHVFFNNGASSAGSITPSIALMTSSDSNSVLTVTYANQSTSTGMVANQAAVDAASPITASAICNCGPHGVGVTSFDISSGTGSGDGTGGGGGSGFVAVTPEPNSMVLLGLGLLGLGSVAWRKHRLTQCRSKQVRDTFFRATEYRSC